LLKTTTWLRKAKHRADRLKSELEALYWACRDARTPWYAKFAAACVVAYAFSPIDLIPDFVPVLGHLDDLVVVPFGIWLALRLVPEEVLDDCRRLARLRADVRRRDWRAGAAVLIVWALAVFGVAVLIWKAT